MESTGENRQYGIEAQRKRAEQQAARDASQLAYVTRGAEWDLAWYYASDAATAGFRAQSYGAGGGGHVYDVGDPEALGVLSLLEESASRDQHTALRDRRFRAGLERKARVESVLWDPDLADVRSTLKLAYAPRLIGGPTAASDRLRWEFRRIGLVAKIPVIEGGKTVYSKAGVPVVEEHATVTLVGIAAETKAARSRFYAEERDAGRYPGPPNEEQLVDVMWRLVQNRKTSVLTGIHAEVATRVDTAVGAYVRVAQRLREWMRAKPRERTAQEVERAMKAWRSAA